MTSGERVRLLDELADQKVKKETLEKRMQYVEAKHSILTGAAKRDYDAFRQAWIKCELCIVEVEAQLAALGDEEDITNEMGRFEIW